MAKATRPGCPVEYRDETALIPDGAPRYTLVLSDEEVEKIASGRLPKRVMDMCWAALSWKRERAQDWAGYPDTLKAPGLEP